jgi:hypothetical protein
LILQLLALQDGFIGVFVAVIFHCHESQWVCSNKKLHWFWLFSHNNMLTPKDVEATLEHFSSLNFFCCKYILVLLLIIVMLLFFKSMCISGLKEFSEMFHQLVFCLFSMPFEGSKNIGSQGLHNTYQCVFLQRHVVFKWTKCHINTLHWLMFHKNLVMLLEAHERCLLIGKYMCWWDK